MKYGLLMLIFMLYGSSVNGQQKTVEANITLISEFQYNFRSLCTWVSLLEIRADLSIEKLGGWKGGFLGAELISIYRTSKNRIADDIQGFSNIDEPTQLLGLYKLGYTQKLAETELFFGLRNINQDYFTTPYTSVFTNSSCGVFPTLSANFPLANYPLSAMCLHVEYRPTEKISIKNSLYNGVAYAQNEDLGRIFTINPSRDGIINLTDFTYTAANGTYNVGIAAASKSSYAVWVNIEQAMYKTKSKEVGAVAQVSYSPLDCSLYYGVGTLLYGFVTSKNRDVFGINIGIAKYQHTTETAIEVTWSIPVSKHFTVQPAYHNIGSTNIAMVRVYYNFGF